MNSDKILGKIKDKIKDKMFATIRRQNNKKH